MILKKEKIKMIIVIKNNIKILIIRGYISYLLFIFKKKIMYIYFEWLFAIIEMQIILVARYFIPL